MMIIDAHCHLGFSPQFHLPDASVATLLRIMDHLQIERAIASPLTLLSGLREPGWDEALHAHHESGGRVLLYTVFDPRTPASLDFVRRSAKETAVVGIKIHPSMHQCPADDDRYRPIWEFAATARLPILTHSWCLSDYNPPQKYSQPALFARYVREFPEVALILGHAGGRYEGHLAAVALAQAGPNVYLDLSGDVYGLGLIEYLVARLGSRRILYGSDLTWLDPRPALGMILDAEVSAADKTNILRDNALQVFHLETKELHA